jgi:hypothetical protein
MSSNITELRLVEPKLEPVAAFVAAAEKILEEVKRGEIIAFGICAVSADGTTFTDVTRGTGEMAKMIAAVTRLQRRIMVLDEEGSL